MVEFQISRMDHLEPGVLELSISPALIEAFCDLALEHFDALASPSPEPFGAGTARLQAVVDVLCHDHDDVHGCNNFNFWLRMRALSAMTLSGLKTLVPETLWRLNSKGVPTPAPGLIRAAMLVPWPIVPESADDGPRRAWDELVDRCIATAISPSGISAFTAPDHITLH